MARKHRWFALSLLLAWSLSHASVRGGDNKGDGKGEPKAENPAEKTRKLLDQTMAIDYNTNSFYDAIQHLREKTRLNISLDNMALQMAGIMPDDPANPMVFPPPRQINLKGERDTKVRTTLQRMLNSYNLSYVILEDSIFITTDETAVHRMMNQRVSVSHKDVPLNKAIKELSQATAINMVIDPRHAKDAQAPVTLDVDDATVETAVKLLAEVGGMKAVRMGNVLFITNEGKADKIRKEESLAPRPPSPTNPAIPLGVNIGGMGFGGGFGGVMPAVPGFVPPAPPPPPADTEPAKPQAPPARDVPPNSTTPARVPPALSRPADSTLTPALPLKRN